MRRVNVYGGLALAGLVLVVIAPWLDSGLPLAAKTGISGVVLLLGALIAWVLEEIR